ncbi:hypothetical protein [Rhodoferax sp.]|uniref:hypothetical protein n=1 Tax=Rhodoferax sp. TaxID=50421 RepID=UPI00275F8EE2|nr:hypothetical protein [Rhodoferax sp.]
MSKALIVLEADRLEFGEFVVTPGGGARQEFRIHHGGECKVVVSVNFPADSEVAKNVITALQLPQAAPVVNTGSVASDITAAVGS